MVQLQKSSEYQASVFQRFLDQVRETTSVKIALEARSETYAQASLVPILKKYKVSQVIADPVEIHPRVASYRAGGFRYFRLHGFPIIYKSKYEARQLQEYTAQICELETLDWCIFDNTTFGHATENAIELLRLTQQK